MQSNLDPKAKMADRAKRPENIIMGNKREAGGENTDRQTNRVTMHREDDHVEYLTLFAQSPAPPQKKKIKVCRRLGKIIKG